MVLVRILMSKSGFEDEVLYKIDTPGIHNSSICIVSLLIRTIGKQECLFHVLVLFLACISYVYY
jgi:hypothetical protein